MRHIPLLEDYSAAPQPTANSFPVYLFVLLLYLLLQDVGRREILETRLSRMIFQRRLSPSLFLSSLIDIWCVFYFQESFLVWRLGRGPFTIIEFSITYQRGKQEKERSILVDLLSAFISRMRKCQRKGAIPFLTLLCSLQFSYGKLIDEDSTTSESIYFIIKVSSRSERTQCLLLLECLFVVFKPVILTVKRYHMALSWNWEIAVHHFNSEIMFLIRKAKR